MPTPQDRLWTDYETHQHTGGKKAWRTSPARAIPEAGLTKAKTVVVIALLRGVNLAGHQKIKMDSLRALCESLGFRDVQTYIQSGNLVFKTGERDLTRLGRRIEDAVERNHGFRPSVVLRTAAELKDVLRKNPFATRRGIEPGKLAITFLGADPGEVARKEVRNIKAEPEELHIDGRELFIYFPNGMGRPKLKMWQVEKALKTASTSRNLNTVTKLLEMAEK